MKSTIKRTQSQTYQNNDTTLQQIGTDIVLGMATTLKQAIKQTTLRDSKKIQNKPQKTLTRIRQAINKSMKRNRQVDCNICQQKYEPLEIKIFSTCLHVFCGSCIDQYLMYKINSGEQVNCPQDTCKNMLVKESELFLQLPIQLRNKFLKTEQFMLTMKDTNIKQCHKPNCEGVFNIKKIPCSCSVCFANYCEKCFYKQHEGYCQDFQIEFLQQNYKFRQCSKCKNVIQKNLGCNHITCRCGHQFCYLCGTNWQQDPCRYGGNPPLAPVLPQPQINCCLSLILIIIKLIIVAIYASIVLPLSFVIGIILLVGSFVVAIIVGGVKLMIQCQLQWWWKILLAPLILIAGIPWYFFQKIQLPCEYFGIVLQTFLNPIETILEACNDQ